MPPTATVEEKSRASGGDANSWGDSPWLAFGVRTIVFLIPILLSLVVTWMLASRWPVPATVPGALGRFGVLAVIALAVAHYADKGARKFLPLATLFRLSLVFPDQAPSRFAVALRSGNTKKLEQRLREAEAGEFSGTEAEAATRIVELAALLSEHDRLTRGHSERVRAFTALIAEEMKLSPEDSNKLQWAGLIHDVGKLRIDEGILTKPGRLTDEEVDIIKTHPDEGMKIAAPLAEYLGEWIGAIGEHHERFDGGGYPKGLAGTDISLAGRIVSVADAYDVITAARSYKKPLPPEFARQELADNAGTQFDPDVVRAFMSISLGRLRRAMWPLSWAAQIPFLGTAVTTPIAQTVAATVVTLATATGATVVTDGFVVFDDQPEAIALVDDTPINDVPVAEVEQPEFPAAGIEVVAIEDGGPTPTTIVVTTAPAAVEGRAPSPAPESTTSSLETETTTTVNSPASGAVVHPADNSPNAPRITTAPRVSNAPRVTVAPRVTTTTTTATSTTITRRDTTTTLQQTATTTITPPSDCERARSGDLELSGANLSSCDLVGVKFVNADFRGANLSRTTFGDGTVFDGGSFVGADFSFATIDGAVFNSVDLTDAVFTDAEIKRTGLNSVNMTRAVFRGATITDTGISATMPNADLSFSTITNVGFSGSKMNNVSIAGSTITTSNFLNVPANGLIATNAQITRVGFDGAGLMTAKFDGTTLNEATFAYSDLTNATFASAKIIDGDFYQARITNASFSNTTMQNINMTETTGPAVFDGSTMADGTMITASLDKSSFRGVEFRNWDFNAASIQNTTFNGSSFVDSSIRSANAKGSALHETQLGNGGLWIVSANLTSASFTNATGRPAEPENAIYNQTICPNGSSTSQPSCW